MSKITDMQDDEGLKKLLENGAESFTKPSRPHNPELYDDKNISKEHFMSNGAFIRAKASEDLEE